MVLMATEVKPSFDLIFCYEFLFGEVIQKPDYRIVDPDWLNLFATSDLPRLIRIH
jgi:hypothetical protein